MGIVEKIESLRALEEQYNARRAAVTEAIVETIRGIGQNPSVRQINKNCFTIRFSDLIGNPIRSIWSIFPVTMTARECSTIFSR